MRSRLVLVLVLGAAGFGLGPAAARADEYHLKDGTVIHGKVLDEDDEEVHLQTQKGLVSLKKADIARVVPEPYPPPEKPPEPVPAPVPAPAPEPEPEPGEKAGLEVELKDGTVLQGRVLDEDDEEITLQTLDGLKAVTRADVARTAPCAWPPKKKPKTVTVGPGVKVGEVDPGGPAEIAIPERKGPRVTGKILTEVAVVNRCAVARENEVAVGGIPLSPGLVTPAGLDKYVIANMAEAVVPSTLTPLALWKDGSVRWLLVQFKAEVPPWGAELYDLVEGKEGRPKPRRLAAAGGGKYDWGTGAAPGQTGRITVDTGYLKFEILGPGFDGIHELWYDPTGESNYGEKGPILEARATDGPSVTVGGKIYHTARDRYGRVDIEEDNPLRVIVRVRGRYVGDKGKAIFRHVTRFIAWADSPGLEIEHTIEAADAGWPGGTRPTPRPAPKPPAPERTEGEGAKEGEGEAKKEKGPGAAPPPRGVGLTAVQAIDFDFTCRLAAPKSKVAILTSTEPLTGKIEPGIGAELWVQDARTSKAIGAVLPKPKNKRVPRETGAGNSIRTKRPFGALAVRSEDTTVALAIREASELAPKALAATPEGRLRLAIHPANSRNLRLWSGVGRTTTFRLELSEEDVGAAAAAAAGRAGAPLRILSQPSWYCRETRVFDRLSERGGPLLTSGNRTLIDRFYRTLDLSIQKLQELRWAGAKYNYHPAAHEYGFLNYGDFTAFSSPPPKRPWETRWANNAYDMPHLLFLAFARTGNTHLLEIACAHALHSGEVGHVAWHPDALLVGAPRPGRAREHVRASGPFAQVERNARRSHVRGLWDLYFFTGSPRAKELALRASEFVRRTPHPASRQDLHSLPGAIDSLLAAYQATGRGDYLARARGVYREALAWKQSSRYLFWKKAEQVDPAALGAALEGYAMLYDETGDREILRQIDRALDRWMKMVKKGQSKLSIEALPVAALSYRENVRPDVYLHARSAFVREFGDRRKKVRALDTAEKFGRLIRPCREFVFMLGGFEKESISDARLKIHKQREKVRGQAGRRRGLPASEQKPSCQAPFAQFMDIHYPKPEEEKKE